MSEAAILVVDDEPYNLEIIAEYLDSSGYRLSLHTRGDRAWEALCDLQNKFDLIILDRMMPDMDGMELLHRIKRDPRLNHLPVIMQTAASHPEQVRQGLSAGAHYYLTKPFEAESLLAIIKAALSDKERFSELCGKVAGHASALQLMQQADFYVRTLEEAQNLAAFIAMLAPVPEMIAMGLSELLVNGIEHGNLGISFAEKSILKQNESWNEEVQRRLDMPQYKNRYVHLHIERRDEEWIFLITDQGEGFDWQAFLDFDPQRAFAPNGRGIAMARQLAFTELQYQGRGNCVRASLRLERSPQR